MRSRAGYLPGTGRCEPRSPVPGLEARGEQWGEPVATTPRATGFSRLPVFLDARDAAPYHPEGPVSPQDKAVYFNAVPLLVVAASYLYVATALAVTLWRERERVTPAD